MHSRTLFFGYGVRHYVRFEDDIFVVLARASSTSSEIHQNRRFLSHMRQRIQHIFKVEVEALSRHHVDMLAVTVSKNRVGCFQTVPKAKPFAMFLDSSSAHAPSVHAKWPVAMMRTISQLCSVDQQVVPQCRAFIERLRSSHFDYTHLIRLENHLTGLSQSRSRKAASTEPRLWLPIVFHPSLFICGLRQDLANFNDSSLTRRLYEDTFQCTSVPRVAIAWRRKGLL